MEPSEAERTILDVQRLRRSTRHALNPIWFPNIAFGLFFIGTAAVGFLDLANTPASLYWVLGRRAHDLARRPRTTRGWSARWAC